MPPKGYKKGYVKHPKTGEYVDTRVLQQEREKEAKEKAEQEKLKEKEKKVIIEKKTKVKDDLGPATKPISDTTEKATVTITWKDSKGRQRTTQYIMADLTINEGLTEVFSGAKKKTHLHISLDGAVLEKI